MSTAGSSRRSFLTTTAALAVALPLAGAAPAAARPRQTPTPPKVGEEFTWRLDAPGTGLRVRESDASVDLSGQVHLRVAEQDSADPWNLKLKVTDFRLTGQDRQGLGEIELRHDDSAKTPDSLLRSISQFPPTWEQTLFLAFTLRIENPPEKLDEPLVLTTKNPGKLLGRLNNFPPNGDAYKLENPVDLVLQDSGETIASIQKFPVKVGGL
ncbi:MULTISPECIES: hypothetical protein [Amycolatopsis]|uniref:Tat (Twin-arginine translocation) pathway signal sequence n=2 Tax=Amycolatopsis TaxID=1813 RepID=A0A1I3XVD4_9PSEU|nr:hypothetical protein [Amycolatopsis sacchari]SFK23528.1 hypothetical protein SAMN05421835_11661 [Amycolatopsis sacchari]